MHTHTQKRVDAHNTEQRRHCVGREHPASSQPLYNHLWTLELQPRGCAANFKAEVNCGDCTISMGSVASNEQMRAALWNDV